MLQAGVREDKTLYNGGMNHLSRLLQKLFPPEKQLVLGTYDPFGLFPLSLPLTSLDTHLYIVGKTKKGKSSFLASLLFQLIT